MNAERRATPAERLAMAGSSLLLVGATAVSVAAAGWLVLDAMNGDAVTWVLGRAAGLASYALITALVVTGLLITHPWARHLHRFAPRTRLAVHVSLAVFTAVFTVLHVVVLALDPWAGVGWKGVFIPMASEYEPVAVTVGALALWSGVITGLTAALAGRFIGRWWWHIHRFAIVILVAVWAHSVFAGSDVLAMRGLYVATGLAVVALALTRYTARTPADRVSALTRELNNVARSGASRRKEVVR